MAKEFSQDTILTVPVTEVCISNSCQQLDFARAGAISREEWFGPALEFEWLSIKI
jgi:hypothetical protein